MTKRYRAPKAPAPLTGASPKAPAGTPGIVLRIRHRECVTPKTRDRRKLREHAFAIVEHNGSGVGRVVAAHDSLDVAYQVAQQCAASRSKYEDAATVRNLDTCCKRARKAAPTVTRKRKAPGMSAQEIHVRSIDVEGKCQACDGTDTARVRNARCVASPVSTRVKALRKELAE